MRVAQAPTMSMTFQRVWQKETLWWSLPDKPIPIPIARVINLYLKVKSTADDRAGVPDGRID